MTQDLRLQIEKPKFQMGLFFLKDTPRHNLVKLGILRMRTFVYEGERNEGRGHFVFLYLCIVLQVKMSTHYFKIDKEKYFNALS